MARHENERSASKTDGLGAVSRRIPSKNQEILKMVPKLTAEQRREALDKGEGLIKAFGGDCRE